ncbi:MULTISPECIES: hypothetical protein [unclassified Pseudoalteromonas]|uniref:hypothetical protein n=1 Tax=unclassified Pseudoalteromonas TaxID=194690 RepID=UPI00390CC6F5|nr:hypothetical protein [Ningiella sp. W23]
MDSIVKQSAIEIGSVTLSAKPKLDNELPLLDCDGSPYFVADYPILASKLERKFIEQSIIPTEITHANVSEYMNSKSTVKVINSVLHIYIATVDTVGVFTSSDGLTFNFTEFSSLLAKGNYVPKVNIIRASDDGQTLLTCNALATFLSKDGGATWLDQTHTSSGVTSLQYWDVSPSGDNMFCATNSVSGSRKFIYRKNGESTWYTTNLNYTSAAYSFYYINESYITYISGSSSDDGLYRGYIPSSSTTNMFDTESIQTTALVRDGVSLISAAFYGGTSTDYSRYYISMSGASAWVKLPYRFDVFGNNQTLNLLVDFLLTASNDLYVANSDGVFLLKDGATSWSRVFKPNSVAEQITGQARLAEINGDVFIITATAFYKTNTVLEDYLFFTPDLSDSPLNSVCKLVGDKQP